MSDLPEPMTPVDCDLRGYDFMPLFGTRLFGSAFYASATDAEFRAALRLWWAAWQQCPAGSLPKDSAALSLLADFGRDVKGFAKVRDVALRGFVECTDGRLYHPLLCQEARYAYEKRVKERNRKAAFRSRDKTADVPPSGGDVTPVSRGTSAGQSVDGDGTGQDRTEQDRTVRKEGKEEEASQPPAARPQRGSRLPLDWEPDGVDAGFAHKLGLNPEVVAAKFRDHWHSKAGKDGIKIDWSATWRNWCRTDAERSAQRPNARQPESKLAWMRNPRPETYQ